MSSDHFTLPAPLEVDLSEFKTLGDNSFQVCLRFDDDAYLTLDFQPGSEGHDVIFDTLAEVADDRLRTLGRDGVVVTGMAMTAEAEDEEPQGS